MRSWLWVPACVGVALFVAVADTNSGLLTWWQLRGQLDEAETRMAEARDSIEALRSEAEALEADDFAIERAIREDLKRARPGETVWLLPRNDLSTPRNP